MRPSTAEVKEKGVSKKKEECGATRHQLDDETADHALA